MLTQRQYRWLDNKLQTINHKDAQAVEILDNDNGENIDQAIELCRQMLAILKDIPHRYCQEFNYQYVYTNAMSHLSRTYRKRAVKRPDTRFQDFDNAIEAAKNAYDCDNRHLDILFDIYWFYYCRYKFSKSDHDLRQTKDYLEKISQFNEKDYGQVKQPEMTSASYWKKKAFMLQADLILKLKDFDQAVDLAKRATKAQCPETQCNTLYNGYAYYVWGCALLTKFMTDEAKEVNKTDYNFCHLLLKKSENCWQQVLKKTVNQENCYYGDRLYTALASLYNKTDFAYYYPDVATTENNIQSYHKVLNEGVDIAYQELGMLYLMDDREEPDYAKAVNYLTIAANKGFESSKLFLAYCYLYGLGCDQDIEKLMYWAGQCRQYTYGKFWYAYSLMHLRRQTGDAEKYPTESITHWLQKAAEDELGDAYMNLALIYSQGWFNVRTNYVKAEQYFREALRLQAEGAAIGLVKLYATLMTTINPQSFEYRNLLDAALEIVNTCFYNFIHDKNDTESIRDIVSRFDDKRESFCVDANKAITKDFHEQGTTPQEKVTRILDNYSLLHNPINVSTSILKIGKLLEQVANSDNERQWLSDQNTQAKMRGLLRACFDFLETNKFSTRSLANIVTGLGHWYRQYYDYQIDALLKQSIDTMLTNSEKLDELAYRSFLTSALRWPIRHCDGLQNKLREFVNATADKQRQFALQDTPNMSTAIYSLVVLDNYYRQYSSQDQQLTIHWDLWRDHIQKQLEDHDHLDKQQLSQYCWALLYIQHYRSNHMSSQCDPEMTAKTHTLLSEMGLETNYSNLQTKVADFIKHGLGIEITEEEPIMGLPVDIYNADHDLIIQVDGPQHYVYHNEQDERDLSLKDHLHDALLRCRGDYHVKQVVTQGNSIIHLDYQKLSQSDWQDYIVSELNKAGLQVSKPKQRHCFNQNVSPKKAGHQKTNNKQAANSQQFWRSKQNNRGAKGPQQQRRPSYR